MSDPTPKERVFVDSNILAYAHLTSETEKHPIAKDLVAEFWENKTAALSTQVLQEFYVVATTKFNPPMTRQEARDLVDEYARWKLIRIDVIMILNASRLEERHKISFWDALILEAAKRAGAVKLITEDLSHGSKLNEVLIQNPFISKS